MTLKGTWPALVSTEARDAADDMRLAGMDQQSKLVCSTCFDCLIGKSAHVLLYGSIVA